ncbi:hypothetical protein DFJ74DRAFT_602867 [Hyaloraphidium curvatum]|nr:hypothetical protein DFJ74DRAFT_602867 [Hyaloraphidium curvatum]
MASPPSDAARPFTVAVVGGGPVGALAAVYMARRGWRVDVYEGRKDPRTDAEQAGRSINLALSTRGIEAMRRAGVVDEVLSWVVPMKGRMIHAPDGSAVSQPYAVTGECINSVGRKRLNEHLLTCAEALSGLKLHFEHTLADLDLETNRMHFKTPGGDVNATADLVIGADGAFSRVRRVLMRKTHMKFSQEYIDHGYVELSMPPAADGGFRLDPNHLHIWPKHTFMMIALPNPDHTFTCTLFMPWSQFNQIHTPKDLTDFFDANFPDAVPNMPTLVEDYFRNPKGALVMAKCTPFHYRDRCLVLGDAAHAMVPFYGQGMNCGMEDVDVLDSILDFILPPGMPKGARPDHGAMEAAFEQYTRTRYPDVTTMMDLALYNYHEMRHDVTDWRYLLRKKIENALHLLFPTRIIPLYTMVSFSQIPYSEVMRRWQRQTLLLEAGAAAAAGIAALGVAYAGFKVAGVRRLGIAADMVKGQKVWWWPWSA